MQRFSPTGHAAFGGRIVLALVLGLLVSSGPARADDPCWFSDDEGGLKVSLSSHPKLGCTVVLESSMSFYRTHAKRTRTVTFYESGLVTFFIGTEDFPKMSRATGVRAFLLLSKVSPTAPVLEPIKGETVPFTAPSGLVGTASILTGTLATLSGFSINLTPLEHFLEMEKAEGGVEVKPTEGHLVIDLGWRTGEIPHARLGRPAIVQDAHGGTCQLTNRDLFRKDPNDRFDVIALHSTRESLVQLIRKRCPSLVFDL